MKKFTTMAICFVLIACMVAGGSLAYLTDRDSEANVFTVGDVKIELNEDFEQGAKLTPGVDIEKAPLIKNTGINDAYVWMEFAIPTALDTVSITNDAVGSSNNVVHWNYLGATSKTYANTERIDKAFTEGKLTQNMFPIGVNNCVDFILSNGATWDFDNNLVGGKNMRTAKIADGKELAEGDNGYADATEYNVYVIPYNRALEPGETTLPGIVNVYLDKHIDIDPEGNWYKVDAGVVTDLDWNTNEDGAPIIYVSAYGIQADGFSGVEAAYEAYKGQWADKGTEWGKPATFVATAGELVAALNAGEDAVLTENIENIPVETIAPYSNYYGVALDGAVLNGNGKTLDFALGLLKNNKADNYGIMTSGGTIKNAEITGVFRGIMIMNPTEDIYIDNVTIGDKDVCYAINTGEGDGTHSLYVTDSTIKGWSSYGTAVKSVHFTNCEFKQGDYYDNVFGRLVKPYVDTVFDSCEFNSKFYIDLSALTTDGDGTVVNPDAKVVLKNCTVNGVKLTADNWKDLIEPEDTCGNGQISIEAKDGSYMNDDNVLDYVIIK